MISPEITRYWFHRLLVLGVLILVGLLILWWSCGCATPQLAAEVERLRAEVNGIKTDVRIGGDGDTITTWILAAGCVAAAAFYPIVVRPLRRRLQRKGA